MPSYYKQIDGWFNFEVIYLQLVERYPQGRFLELGTWLGKSTCFMAELIKESGRNIKFFAVDNFTGASDAKNQLEDVQNAGGSIYYKFLENMRNAGVLDFVIPINADSTDAAKLFDDQSIDFVFIDANHTYEFVTKDLQTWYPKVKVGGFIGGHDFWMEAVKKAVTDFLPTPCLDAKQCWLYRKP